MGNKRRWSQLAGTLATEGVRYGVKAYKRYKEYKSEQKKRFLDQNSNYTTVQHDSRTQYVRKKMPKAKKKRWVKFSRKVRAVIHKNLGKGTLVRNSAGNGFNWKPSVDLVGFFGPQTWGMATLLGSAGSTSITGYTHGQDDLNELFKSENQDLLKMSKVVISSAILDITLSARFAGANTVPLEIDVYHVMCYGPGQRTTGGPCDLYTVMKDTYAMPNQNPDSFPRTTGLGRGETLFDIPGLLKTQQWKILKKTKMFVNAGSQITYQHRDSKDHVIRGETMFLNAATNTMQLKGITQHIIFCAKPIIGYSWVENTPLFEFGVTRKYSYRILDLNQEVTARA